MASTKYYKGDFFHVFNKSISNYGIFNDLSNAKRFVNIVNYYNKIHVSYCFSYFIKKNPRYLFDSLLTPKENGQIKILAYCIMPDHYHLLVKIHESNMFAKYINDVENSYTRYFNIKNDRKGPLWQSAFKAVKIKNNEQLLHVSRYIHLNPVVTDLVAKPEEWFYSSYKEYLDNNNILGNNICEISITNGIIYQRFCEDQIDYHKKLKIIKKCLL